MKSKKSQHKRELKQNKKILQDNVKLIEQFNSLNYENKKIRDDQKLIEVFMETVLGSQNFKRMLLSIENDAIMGKPKKASRVGKHKRKQSGHPPRVPLLADSAKTSGLNTARGLDPKAFKAILQEFDKNKQNVSDQNKMMDDIQNQMLRVTKEFGLKKFTPGSQSHRVLENPTPDTTDLTNFIPLSGRSTDIRNRAKEEMEKVQVDPTHIRKRSLPSIHE